MTSAPKVDLAHVPATASQETAASPDERRQITVMFCDLVGSVALSQRLDSEDYRDVMRAYRGACKEEVERYEGFDTGSGQFLGDGVMAYFGWPTAHEDDAERSVLSALGIVQAVKSLSAAEPLAVRIGIATGLVVVGGHPGRAAETPGWPMAGRRTWRRGCRASPEPTRS